MRRSTLAVLALVATASVSASTLPPTADNGNIALLSARDNFDDYKPSWCYCDPRLDGDDAYNTARCCPDILLNFDGQVCNNLNLEQSLDFAGCCDDHNVMCGDMGTTPTNGPKAANQSNLAHISGRKDDGDEVSWCYCDGDMHSKEDSQTNMCCPTGHYDVDLLVCSYLKPRDIIPFEECCAEQKVVCEINGTDPNNSTVPPPPVQSVESVRADTTPGPPPGTLGEHFGPPYRGHTTSYSGPWPTHRADTTSYSGPWPTYHADTASYSSPWPTHGAHTTSYPGPWPPARSPVTLDERFGPRDNGPISCFVGHCCPPVKYNANTEKCCPVGHYNSTRALCLDLNDDMVHDFIHCALEFYAYCFDQLPDWVTTGAQAPTKTERLKLRTSAPDHLEECFAGRDLKSKNMALTKKCCPGGYFDEQQEVCQNSTPSRKHDFLQCLPDHISTCAIQRPKLDLVLV